MLSNFKFAALAVPWLTLTITGVPFQTKAQDVVFLSTQLRQPEEAQKMRDILLKGAPKTSFVVDEPSAFAERLKTEFNTNNHQVSLVGALHGELQALASLGVLDSVDDVADELSDRHIPTVLMEAGKFGGPKQVYIPWMQATYVFVVKKDALPFLPPNADVNALSYDQLAQWAKTIAENTGQRRLGFPAGTKGLLARFLQGYLYPSYTGSVVSEFRSADAAKMWSDFKALWTSVNPNSAKYDFMQDPLQSGEVWIAWDHIARFKDALQASPSDYQIIAPPEGPKGRAYMSVVVGLSVLKNAPDRAGAVAVIQHLSKPETQIVTAAETGFLPVVEAGLLANSSPETKLIAEGFRKTQAAKDGLVVMLPVGLGDKADEFDKVFTDTFQRVVLRGEPVQATLDAQASVMRDIFNTTKAACWIPDQPSDGPCPVK